jgi:hypothetical protein
MNTLFLAVVIFCQVPDAYVLPAPRSVATRSYDTPVNSSCVIENNGKTFSGVLACSYDDHQLVITSSQYVRLGDKVVCRWKSGESRTGVVISNSSEYHIASIKISPTSINPPKPPNKSISKRCWLVVTGWTADGFRVVKYPIYKIKGSMVWVSGAMPSQRMVGGGVFTESMHYIGPAISCKGCYIATCLVKCQPPPKVIICPPIIPTPNPPTSLPPVIIPPAPPTTPVTPPPAPPTTPPLVPPNQPSQPAPPTCICAPGVQCQCFSLYHTTVPLYAYLPPSVVVPPTIINCPPPPVPVLIPPVAPPVPSEKCDCVKTPLAPSLKEGPGESKEEPERSIINWDELYLLISAPWFLFLLVVLLVLLSTLINFILWLIICRSNKAAAELIDTRTRRPGRPDRGVAISDCPPIEDLPGGDEPVPVKLVEESSAKTVSEPGVNDIST